MNILSAANQEVRNNLDSDIRDYAERYNEWIKYKERKFFSCPYPLEKEAPMLDRIVSFVGSFRDENDRKDNVGHFVLMTKNYLRSPFRKHALAIVASLVSDADSLHDIDKIRYLRFLQRPDSKTDDEPCKLLSALYASDPKLPRLLKKFATFNVLKNEENTKKILSDFKSCIEKHNRNHKDIYMVKDLVNTLVDSNDGFNREQISKLAELYFLTTEKSEVSPNEVFEESNFLENAMAREIGDEKNETLKDVMSSYCEYLAASKKSNDYLKTQMKRMLGNGIYFGNMNRASMEELKAVFKKLPKNRKDISQELMDFTEVAWRKYVPTNRNIVWLAEDICKEEACYHGCSEGEVAAYVQNLEKKFVANGKMYGKKLSLFDENGQNTETVNKSLVNKVVHIFATTFVKNKGNIHSEIVSSFGAMLERFVHDYDYSKSQVRSLLLSLCPIKTAGGEKLGDVLDEKDLNRLKKMTRGIIEAFKNRNKTCEAGERALTPAMVLRSKGRGY
ncbi:MAG: hypothetical protein MJ210_03890 [Alphaproteobacteria bacterium]|nr:hypothetical protein [Alphaproteobacteria bacterium]